MKRNKPLRAKTGLQAKQGLKRSTELRAKTGLQRRAVLTTKTPLEPSTRPKPRTPLKAEGERKLRLAPWHRWSRGQVMERCTEKRTGDRCCEACMAADQLDWAHLFQRGNLIAEPWCSLPELTMGLCRRCHNAVDRHKNPELAARLRWRALGRLYDRFEFLVAEIDVGGDDPIACARACERLLKLRDLTSLGLPQVALSI